MNDLNKPLAASAVGELVDTRGKRVGIAGLNAEQIVHELNAYDDLLAACKLALSCNPCGGCEIALRRAVEKAEKQS